MHPPNRELMKMIIKPMYLVFFLMISVVSCNNEELFIEPVAEVVVDVPEDTPAEDTETTINATLPCDFTLDTVQANTTVIINCIMDLGGATINLPANVTIVYEGGDIINGTLNFSDNTVISGELLNSSITITGSKPQMKDTTFNFDPERWGIVEGKVSDDVALNNKEILQLIIDQTKEMGITTFEIDKLDAYFKVDLYYGQREANAKAGISIPSNFHFKMNDNTFLRVQPNAAPFYTLISTWLTENTTISGGHLVGDRYEHDYSPVIDITGTNRDTHEYGQIIHILGSENIQVENVDISDPTGDGIVMHSETLRQPDGTLYPGKKETKNVIIKNCKITRARRNGISFLDGRFITIDNCTISDTGKGDRALDASGTKIASSSGTAPMYGIDLEAIRTRSADGTLERTALIEMVSIKNSHFRGNHFGDIVLYTCNDVTLENNTFDAMVANFAADNIIIRNNIFEARLESDGKPYSRALLLLSRLSPLGKEFNYSYEISNNKINGYESGMILSGTDFKVYNNEISNCGGGIKIGDLIDAQIHDNKVYSRGQFGVGLVARGGLVQNVSVYNENYDVNYRPIDFRNHNDAPSEDHDYLKIFDCTFNSEGNRDVYLDNSHYIQFDNITSNVGIEIVNGSTNIIQN
jgi:hypothetical protein